MFMFWKYIVIDLLYIMGCTLGSPVDKNALLMWIVVVRIQVCTSGLFKSMYVYTGFNKKGVSSQSVDIRYKMLCEFIII